MKRSRVELIFSRTASKFCTTLFAKADVHGFFKGLFLGRVEDIFVGFMRHNINEFKVTSFVLRVCKEGFDFA